MRSGFVRLIGVVSFLSFSLFLFQFAASAQSVSNVTVHIIEAPPLGGGSSRLEPLKARVNDPDGICGPEFNTCRVALFSFAGGQWYPQPYLNRQLVEMDGSGLVEENVHLGIRYAALLVRTAGYAEQPAAIMVLPDGVALAQDEAEAGAVRPDDEASTTSPSLTAVSPPLTEAARPAAALSDRLTYPLRPSYSSLTWVANFFRHPLVLVILAFALLALFLTASGQLTAFIEALEYSLRQLIHILASRLSRLQAVIKVKTNGPGAAKSAIAVFCFVVAIGAAIANFVIVKFSFELLLPTGDALTIVAVIFVVLKGAGGVLLHFFERPTARLAAGFFLILAAACSLTVAYKRTLAIQELNSSTRAVSVPQPAVEWVRINERILRNLPAADQPGVETNTPAAVPPSSAYDWLFTQEAPVVAALTLVMDGFEILCIFAAFQLSANAVVCVLCLPIRLPLSLAKEVLWLIDRTKLMRVISVLIEASLVAPRVIATLALKVITKLLHASVEAGQKAAAAAISAGRRLLARWRKRRIFRARRAAVLERVRLREGRRIANAIGVEEMAGDRLISMLNLQQRQNEFAKEELNATLDHRAKMNQMLRDKAQLVFAQNLYEIEALFARIGAELANATEKTAEGIRDAKADTVADAVTKALGEQFKKMGDAQTRLDGFYPQSEFQEQGQSHVPVMPERCARSY